MEFFRSLIHRHLPAHFHHPFGLFLRLLRTRDPAARFAIVTAVLGVLFTPVDLLLHIAEKRRYQRARPPQLPLIFVVGAPRTGTTLVAQVLINHLPVCFINNLTAIFPRSPLVANLVCRTFLKHKQIDYQSYYGKSLYLSGPNDGLQLWDRWIGHDRRTVPDVLSNAQKDSMTRFFGAFEAVFQKPILNKNNSLNMYARLIADVFENAYFICMTRDPLYLAQALLRARAEIHGNVFIPYGVDDPNRKNNSNGNYVEDVCRQVLFHEKKIKEHQSIIGHEKFWIISYEEFCEKPAILVQRVSEQILGRQINMAEVQATLGPFKNTNRRRIDHELFTKIEQTLLQLRETVEPIA
jgi:Sulfotransferase family